MDNGAVWARIISITPVTEEDVYDVEIEGTHNFIGNYIVAHNTYLTGGLGAGLLNTTAGTIQTSGLITGGSTLTLSGTTGTTTLASSQGFTIGASQLVVQQGSGNVGIGDVFAGAFRAKDEICVDDQCLNKDDVRALLQLVHASSTAQTATASSAPTSLTTEEPVVASSATSENDTGGPESVESSSPESAPVPEPAPQPPAETSSPAPEHSPPVAVPADGV